MPYLLVVVAFALRLHRIDCQGIWRDEGVSLHLAASSIPAILANRASDVHPPLYFILLHFWTGLAGFSELSARFFSLIFGVLLVPSLYHVVRKIFGTRTALATMAVAAFSPLYVVYSQEVRTYTMLPLCYLLIIYRLYQLARGEKLAWRHWIELMVVEVLCLHLHYFSIFAVAYVNLFLAALWLRHRDVNLRRWLSSQVFVALSCVPWAWMVIESWTAAGPPKPALAGPALRMTFFELANFIWHFFNGGNDLRDHRLFAPLSYWLAVTLIVALLLSIRADDRRQQILITLCHLMASLIMVFVVYWWKPVIAPRYVIMLSVPFFILAGRVIAVLIEARGPVKLTGLSLALTLTATFSLGLRIAFFDPTFFKDDGRALVEYLEPLANADDVIIVHPTDYSVEYYYTGDAPIAMIDPDDTQLAASLQEALRGKRRAFLVWPFGTPRDLPGLLPFLLEMNGRFAGQELFKGYSLRIYEPERAIFLPEVEPALADFGDVRLTGAFYQGGDFGELSRAVEADDAICLALRWQLVRATKRAYKVVVILWDEAGRRLSGADMLLTNPRWGLSTERWIPGEEEVNYYIVPVPIGTPPISYRITVGVYDVATMERVAFLDEAGHPAGEDFPLGEVALTKAYSFERDPYGTRRHLSLETLDRPEIADGLALEGFVISKAKARPQEVVSVVLRWRALREGLPQYAPRLRLRRGDAIWAEVGSTFFEERYPTTKWAEGEVVFEQRDFAYPPRVGQAVLEVEVAGGAVALGGMELDTSGLAFEAPPIQHQVGVRFGDPSTASGHCFAELLGYDLDQTEATTDEKVRLTLYWRAINEEPLTTSFTVFTHLLSEDGRLIGQHDGVPAEGERPTMSWVPGEVIADVHELEFSDLAYRGKALIEVGLYESLTIERVPTEEERDHLILPSEVTIK